MLEGGKIAVTGPGRTSIDGVWAGGDCTAGGDDLTVTAVAQGRDAAEGHRRPPDRSPRQHPGLRPIPSAHEKDAEHGRSAQ